MSKYKHDAPGIKRLRGRALQARRLRVWSRSPYCAKCGKLCAYPAGFELDHVVALCNDGEDKEEDTQILCAGTNGCHARKTADDMGYRFRPTIGVDGYPVE